jgi:hypothetical protein
MQHKQHSTARHRGRSNWCSTDCGAAKGQWQNSAYAKTAPHFGSCAVWRWWLLMHGTAGRAERPAPTLEAGTLRALCAETWLLGGSSIACGSLSSAGPTYCSSRKEPSREPIAREHVRSVAPCWVHRPHGRLGPRRIHAPPPLPRVPPTPPEYTEMTHLLCLRACFSCFRCRRSALSFFGLPFGCGCCCAVWTDGKANVLLLGCFPLVLPLLLLLPPDLKAGNLNALRRPAACKHDIGNTTYTQTSQRTRQGK